MLYIQLLLDDFLKLVFYNEVKSCAYNLKATSLHLLKSHWKLSLRLILLNIPEWKHLYFTSSQQMSRLFRNVTMPNWLAQHRMILTSFMLPTWNPRSNTPREQLTSRLHTASLSSVWTEDATGRNMCEDVNEIWKSYVVHFCSENDIVQYKETFYE